MSRWERASAGTGAAGSRGYVFGYPMGCKQINEDAGLKRLLVDYKTNFEDALARMQADYRTNRAATHKQLEALQSALGEMFADMDAGFQDAQFEFQNHTDYMLLTFMIRFDAIFSLNQDTLLERCYLNDNVALSTVRRWMG